MTNNSTSQTNRKGTNANKTKALSAVSPTTVPTDTSNLSNKQLVQRFLNQAEKSFPIECIEERNIYFHAIRNRAAWQYPEHHFPMTIFFTDEEQKFVRKLSNDISLGLSLEFPSEEFIYGMALGRAYELSKSDWGAILRKKDLYDESLGNIIRAACNICMNHDESKKVNKKIAA